MNGNWPSSSTSALPIGSRPSALSCAKVFGLHRAARRDPLRPRPEQVRRQHVELRRLVDRLDRVLPEQAGRPRRSGCRGTSSPRCTGRRAWRVRATTCGWNGLFQDRRVAVEDRLSRSAFSSSCSSPSGLLSSASSSSICCGVAVLAEAPGTSRTAAGGSTVVSFASGRRCSGTSAAPRRSAGSCSGAPRSSSGTWKNSSQL